jgi:spermidine synthase
MLRRVASRRLPMTPWTRIDRADGPDGTRLELFRRGKEYSIRANGELLMNSRVHGSEEALAELAIAALPGRRAPKLLVGGLGCGYTLAAALGRLGADGSVTVAEIVPAVVRWNREILGELNGRPLDDPRVVVLEQDICALFRAEASAAPAASAAPEGFRQRFDAILLDVDNGPRAVARPSNAWLYSPAGLAAIRGSLEPRGVLAVWSAGPEVGFSDRMRAAGFEVVMHRARSHAAKTRQRHLIWLGTSR